MAGLRDRQVGALSGGQRRRVFLAKAIAAEPELYLLDEPVTGVDATTQEELMDVLEGEAHAGKTVIASTHDLICAAQRFQEAAFVNGRIVATGPAEMVLDRDLLSDTYGGHVLILPGDGGRPRPRRRPPSRPGGRRRAALPRGPLMDIVGFFTDPMAYGFMQRGLVAAIVVGIVCAVMGTFVVLKGIAFIGDAVSHASFPGVVIAFIVGLPIYLGGAIAAVGTALAIGFVSRRSRLRLDTAIGVLFAGAFAFGVLLYSTIDGYTGDLLGYLLGNILGIGLGDLIQVADPRGGRPGDRRRDPQGAAVRDVRPARRGRIRPSRRRAGVPAARPARGHDHREHPGGRDHPGRRDARHARRRRPSCSSSGSTG